LGAHIRDATVPYGLVDGVATLALQHADPDPLTFQQHNHSLGAAAFFSNFFGDNNRRRLPISIPARLVSVFYLMPGA
jgi:hypothetical protein